MPSTETRSGRCFAIRALRSWKMTRRRPSRVWRVGGRITPKSTRRYFLLGPCSTMPKPVTTSPGSMPRTIRAGPLLGRAGRVEIRPDVVHVVVVFHRVDELHHLSGLGGVESDVVVRIFADLGVVRLDSGGLDRIHHRAVSLRSRVDLEAFRRALDIVGSGLERDFHQFVFRDLV